MDVFDQNPCPFTRNTTLDEHALYPLVFCVRTLLVNTPFYPRACVQMPTREHLHDRVYLFAGREGKKGVHDSANQCSGRDVAIGGWRSGVRWRGDSGRKDVPARLPLSYLRLYFSPFRRDTVFVLWRVSSRETKGEMRKCAATLNFIISECFNFSRVAHRKGRRKQEISKVIHPKYGQCTIIII